MCPIFVVFIILSFFFLGVALRSSILQSHGSFDAYINEKLGTKAMFG